jgi:hypothetical protein
MRLGRIDDIGAVLDQRQDNQRDRKAADPSADVGGAREANRRPVDHAASPSAAAFRHAVPAPRKVRPIPNAKEALYQSVEALI